MTHADGVRALFRLPRFRRLLAVRLTSQTADGAFQVALAAYVVFSPERQATPGQIASALAVLLLPFSLVGPFTGVLLDRIPRRRVLVASNLLRTVLALGTAALLLASTAEWTFYAAALAVTAVNRFVLAGLSAAQPRVVPAERLVLANAISPTAGTIAATVGGGTAFVVQFAVPPGRGANAVVVGVAGLLYLASAALARTFPAGLLGPGRDAARPPVREALAGTLNGLRDGLRQLADRRAAGDALAAVTAMRLCYGVLTVMVLMLCRYTFNDPADPSAGMRSLGLALGASGAGFFVAAVITPAVSRRLTVPGWIVCCAACAAVLEPALGLTFRQVPAIIAAFVLGIVTQGVKISADTVVQREVDDAFRGRVFAVYDMLFNLAFVGSAGIAAAVLPLDGRSPGTMAGVAAGYALIALAYRGRNRRRPRADAR